MQEQTAPHLPWRIDANLRSHLVIPTGGIMGLRPTQGSEKRLDPATTSYGAVALSLVIPSEAEGSAIPGPFVEMFFDRAKRSGGICSPSGKLRI